MNATLPSWPPYRQIKSCFHQYDVSSLYSQYSSNALVCEHTEVPTLQMLDNEQLVGLYNIAYIVKQAW